MPQFEYITLPSGRKLIRFPDLENLYFYDELRNNPQGLGMRGLEDGSYGLEKLYLEERGRITPSKQRILNVAQKNMKMDQDFLGLVYKAKADKRQYELNKHGGNLSMPQYAANADKIFKKGKPGAKKQTLNIAFQVGTFVGQNYEDAFIRIVKTVMMCQAMNISLNIDVFDSDVSAIKNTGGYVICNVIKSSEKLNLKKLLACSHPEFFNGSLFNGYSASNEQDYIGGFLTETNIVTDLGPYYDIIGGNLLLDKKEKEKYEMVSQILKIGIDGIRT